jgi:hypothetical protein
MKIMNQVYHWAMTRRHFEGQCTAGKTFDSGEERWLFSGLSLLLAFVW